MNWEMFAKLRVQRINFQTISGLRYNSFIISNCCRTKLLKDFMETLSYLIVREPRVERCRYSLDFLLISRRNEYR